jgi:hypothetical protein
MIGNLIQVKDTGQERTPPRPSGWRRNFTGIEGAGGLTRHAKIQIQFELRRQEATLVGFWSSEHQGTFTPMGSNIHVHFQTTDNKLSGHVQGLDLAASGMTFCLPKG